MTAHMDTLRFAQHLRQNGMDQKQAEALANGIVDHIMPEVATKSDLETAKADLEKAILRQTIWLGGTVMACTAALAILIELI